MWPWEHLLFAYLIYSPYQRLRDGRAPTGAPTVALFLGALLPDLIDKPLGWHVGIATSGYGPAHSVLVAVPMCVLIVLLSRREGRARIGEGFAIGYLLHLVGDVVPISLAEGKLVVGHLLWPLVDSSRPNPHPSFLEATYAYLVAYGSAVTSLSPTRIVTLQLVLATAGGLLWLLDGCPGLRRYEKSRN